LNSSDKPQKAGMVTTKSSQFREHNGDDLANNPLRMTWSPAGGFNSTDSEVCIMGGDRLSEDV